MQEKTASLSMVTACTRPGGTVQTPIPDKRLPCPLPLTPEKVANGPGGWGIMALILAPDDLDRTGELLYPRRGVICGGEASGNRGRACGQREPGGARQ